MYTFLITIYLQLHKGAVCMYVKIGDREFPFYHVELEVVKTGIQNTFANFDKKTLGQLIQHPRYKPLKDKVENDYNHLLRESAGTALFNLKKQGDLFYKEFLNKYGDLTYSQLVVKGNESLLNKTGVYLIILDDELVFTGVCANSFKTRFNQHIGNISPKSCFKDGTATHCHINARITHHFERSKVHFKICPLKNNDEMKEVKNSIIDRFEPVWNLRFGREKVISY